MFAVGIRLHRVTLPVRLRLATALFSLVFGIPDWAKAVVETWGNFFWTRDFPGFLEPGLGGPPWLAAQGPKAKANPVPGGFYLVLRGGSWLAPGVSRKVGTLGYPVGKG